MLHAHELQQALGLPLEAINWHSRDFQGLPDSGRLLLMGADGQFREPGSEREVTEYFLGGEWYQVEEARDDEDDDEDLILWL